MTDTTIDVKTGTQATTTSPDTNNTSSSTDGTSETVKNNDPEKNKKLAEIRMMEELRNIYQLTIELPRVPIGLKTGMFLFIPISDKFYEKNYMEIMEIIANTKFARYAGIEKGRFYIEKIEENHGFNRGVTLTVNPIPPSFAEYSTMMVEAEKALIQAINSEKNTTTTGSVSSTTGGGGISEGASGLTTMSGSDCSETFGIATKSFDINKTCNNKIGNSSANYATDTANMTGKEALLDIWNRFKYNYYNNNRTCPRNMWNKSGTIRGNCADISRLCMCVGQIHGMTIGIRHMSGHYYNLIQIDGKTYRFDCCCKSGGYRGETTNTLLKKYGGPW